MRLTDTQVEFREQEGPEVSTKASHQACCEKEKSKKIQIFLDVKTERLEIFAEISPLKNEVFKRVK